MRLIIQIPAYEEEETLGVTLSELPRELPGIDCIEWLVIDDGSRDRTAQVARVFGADHILRFSRHRGLAAAFSAGLEACLELGADIIVNTDADNQYQAADIPRLLEPILEGRADMVVGTRPVREIEDFSALKKFLQAHGSRLIRALSRTDVRDCTSGFRAFRREAAMRLKVFGDYTYTIETILHAGQKGMAVTSVPVRINPVRRPSRLVKSIPGYLLRSALTVVRHVCTYRPVTIFIVPGLIAFTAGMALGSRFLVLWLTGGGSGHVQSLILSAVLLVTSFVLFVAGLLADLLSVNRKLLEGIDGQVQRMRQATAANKRPSSAFHAYLRRKHMTLETMSVE